MAQFIALAVGAVLGGGAALFLLLMLMRLVARSGSGRRLAAAGVRIGASLGVVLAALVAALFPWGFGRLIDALAAGVVLFGASALACGFVGGALAAALTVTTGGRNEA